MAGKPDQGLATDPIAWTGVEHVRGHSSGTTQLELLTYVRHLLPQGIAVLLVSDSEFGPAESEIYRQPARPLAKTNPGVW